MTPPLWAAMFLALMAICGFLGVGVYSYLTGQGPGAIIGNLTHKPFDGKREVRILVLGVDDKVEHGRSDTIIVASINLETKDVRALSIPRDTRVRIPGRQGIEKINASFSHGGAELSKKVVEQLLGITIDGYVKTNIGGFKGIVDKIGGVDLFVEKNMRYTDHAQDLHINLKKGQQHLDSEKAMEYVRFRHDLLGDITRMQRQQKFLKAVMAKMAQPSSWPRIPGIVLGSREFLETDVLPNDLIALASLAREVKMEGVRMETLPGVPRSIGGVSYFIPDETETPKLVQSIFFAPSAVEATGPCPPVQVFNGNGARGLAGEAKKVLEQNGYKVISAGNADHFGYESSQVIAAKDVEEGARKITQVLGCGSVVVSNHASPNSPVTIILGKDYHPQSSIQ